MMSETVQKPTEKRGFSLRRWVGRIAANRPLTLLLSLYMTLRFPQNFPTAYNIGSVLLNMAQQGILVVGMMLLMIAGSFDLSIGSTLALSGVASALAITQWGWPVLLGIAVGALAGLVNGFITTRIGINALITTLATMTIFRGITQLLSGSGISPISDDFAKLGQTVVLGVEPPFWVMVLMVILGTWAVGRTRFFRQFYFIGGNPRAAQLSGIKVAQLTLVAFVLTGALAGLAGVLGAARLNAAVVTAGIGVELNVITAAVLGGASLKEGEGTVISL
jgi:ribose transport system permease protein